MASNDVRDLDAELAALRKALNRVHAPDQLRDRVVPGRAKKRAFRTSAWISAGLAAAMGAVLIGSGFFRPAAVPQPPETRPAPISGLLVARTRVPVRVQSLSRGAELRYLDSHLVRDERGLTRVVYVQLPEGN